MVPKHPPGLCNAFAEGTRFLWFQLAAACDGLIPMLCKAHPCAGPYLLLALTVLLFPEPAAPRCAALRRRCKCTAAASG